MNEPKPPCTRAELDPFLGCLAAGWQHETGEYEDGERVSELAGGHVGLFPYAEGEKTSYSRAGREHGATTGSEAITGRAWLLPAQLVTCSFVVVKLFSGPAGCHPPRRQWRILWDSSDTPSLQPRPW